MMMNHDNPPPSHDPVTARCLAIRMADRRRAARRDAIWTYCISWLFPRGRGPQSASKTDRRVTESTDNRSSTAKLIRVLRATTLARADFLTLEPRIVPL
jgi:hypothetical protein